MDTYYQKHGYRRNIAARDAELSPAKREDEARVQLKEEELKVGKREIEYGGFDSERPSGRTIVNKPVELKREE